MTPEELQALAAQQWLDPQILSLAADSIWLWQWQPIQDPMLAMEEPIGAPQGQPQPEMVVEDIYAQSPLVIHADEMIPMMQQASQDEVMAFVRKIMDIYLSM